MNLLIVESPNKCRKIESFLGKGWKVIASYGHVRGIPSNSTNVDLETYEPVYAVDKDKIKVVADIKSSASDANDIYLATDPDREGEAISAHIHALLPAKDKKKCRRVTFHEITKKAVTDAIANPRDIDRNLVDAQKARQVLDRLIGYGVSPLVWRVQRGTSAGRVQSTALRIICDRQKEIDIFKPEDYWHVDANFRCKNGEFPARAIHDKGDRFPQKEASDILAAMEKASFVLEKIEKSEKRVAAYPPFDTTSLQTAASSLFGWSAVRTMRAAQAVFEMGFISYHRTDSYNLSKEAVDEARELIASKYPSGLPAKPNVYVKKSSAASQEAHEAIRPTHLSERGSDLSGDEKALYDLVWKRFVACQMTPAVLDTVRYTVKASSGAVLEAKGQVIRERGWLEVYSYSNMSQNVLPEAQEGESLVLVDAASSKHSTQPPAHYNDGSLVKRMEDDGIGRPSTRASIIKAIQDKGYVDKEGKALAPTPLGIKICDFLTPRFDDMFMDLKYTSKLEEDLDLIAEGKRSYLDVVKPVNEFLRKKITVARASIPKKVLVSMGAKCPVCKKGDVVEREGRFGKFFSCGNYPKCKAILIESEGKYIPKVKASAEKSGKKCPDCGKEMLVRINRTKGTKFLGCSQYPRCKHTDKID